MNENTETETKHKPIVMRNDDVRRAKQNVNDIPGLGSSQMWTMCRNHGVCVVPDQNHQIGRVCYSIFETKQCTSFSFGEMREFRRETNRLNLTQFNCAVLNGLNMCRAQA